MTQQFMKAKLNFDDSTLPVNNLTPERMEEIEELMMPRLKQAFKELRKVKPYLFKDECTAKKEEGQEDSPEKED